ncbi:MAG: hypothetical protein A4E53_03669 [Pelotomaculum sp. PtaB.Bin104]|nr:MAG: hypothetical protein A4E53_03669 [Pelotomaculum sp. PtaB.Bin104]
MIPNKKNRGQSPDNPDLIVPGTAAEECETCAACEELEEESCPGTSACKDDENSLS